VGQFQERRSFVKGSDKLFIYVSFVMGCILTLSIPGPEFIPLNAFLMEAIPPSIGIFFLFIPFIMYWGLNLSLEKRHSDYTKKEKLRNLAEIEKKLLFRCRYKTHDMGSSWEIYNANPFTWHNSRILIERSVDGKKETEKLYLGNFKKGEKRQIESTLDKKERAQWRVLILSLEGQMLDFPDVWKELEPHNVKI
jgi:hypothetical protein